MTKKELEKEAEEWLCNNLHSASEEDFIKAMVDIAEPREKRIAELKNSLSGIVYMATNGLHVKNQIAFERCIAEAEKLLKKVEK